MCAACYVAPLRVHAAFVGTTMPPEMVVRDGVTEGASMQSVTYMLAAVAGTMFRGELNSVTSASGVKCIEPEPLAHYLGNMLSDAPEQRMHVDEAAKHFIHWSRNYSQQALFIEAVGNSLEVYVKHKLLKTPYVKGADPYAEHLDLLDSKDFMVS
jgi:hypothetical protein